MVQGIVQPPVLTWLTLYIFFHWYVCLLEGASHYAPIISHYIPLSSIIPSTCLPVLLNSSKFYWLHTWCSLIKCSPSPQSLSSLNRWKPPVFREFSSHVGGTVGQAKSPRLALVPGCWAHINPRDPDPGFSWGGATSDPVFCGSSWGKTSICCSWKSLERNISWEDTDSKLSVQTSAILVTSERFQRQEIS